MQINPPPNFETNRGREIKGWAICAIATGHQRGGGGHFQSTIRGVNRSLGHLALGVISPSNRPSPQNRFLGSNSDSFPPNGLRAFRSEGTR